MKCHICESEMTTVPADVNAFYYYCPTCRQVRSTKTRYWDAPSMTENGPIQVGGDHYSKLKVQPFDLQKAMESSGDCFVDGCRCIIVKYAARKKGAMLKMAEDLRKAAHYAIEAAQHIESHFPKND